MDIEITKELFKLVSSLDKDWNGNERSQINLVQFLNKNQQHIADFYLNASFSCLSEYSETELHLLRYELINEILVEENKEKRNYFVYKHAVPNGKVYIGITCCQNAELRWLDGWGYKQNAMFYDDIKHYGWNNIAHEILYKNLSPADAQKIEIELINKHQSRNPQYGYNLDNGGKISTTPYIWTTWKYDIDYQFRAKRRPFKVIVDLNDMDKFEQYIEKYEGKIIKSTTINELTNHIFIIASNPSFKEKQIREELNSYLNKNKCDIQIYFYYGAVDGLPFEYNEQNKILIIRMHAIDKNEYKFDSVISDLKNTLNFLI